MQSSIAGTLGQRKRLGGMTKLMNPRPFVVPTMRNASMPMTMTNTAMTMANSNTTTNTANATSMVSCYSSSTTIATMVANDAMKENLNTNTTTTTTTTTMASVKTMMMNSTRLLPANDTTASAMASPTIAAAYTSVDTTTATRRKSAATTATTATTSRSAATTATTSRSAATLKRKYDDSEDVSEDDSDDDDYPPPPPPPPKKRNHARSSEDSPGRIKKRIKKYLLQNMSPFKKVLLTRGAFGPKQWGQLYEQLGDDDKYVRELFFSKQNKKWREDVLSAARDIVAPYRLGHVSSMAARTALVIGETAPFTPTLRFAVDDEANDVATGNLVRTLEEYRNGNDDFIPPSDEASCFAKGNLDKAWEFALLEHNSILEHAAESYAYAPAVELAAEVKEKYGLSSSFPTFADGSYVAPVSFTSGKDIKEMYELPREGLDARVKTFLNENVALVEGSDDYENALHRFCSQDWKHYEGFCRVGVRWLCSPRPFS